MLKKAEALGFERVTFSVEIIEVAPDVPLERNGYAIVPFAVDHADPHPSVMPWWNRPEREGSTQTRRAKLAFRKAPCGVRSTAVTLFSYQTAG